MDEDQLIETFVEDISTYPFKTHVQKEVKCRSGRADIVLPDYDIVIEAKADGSMKKAIGQATWYSECMDMHGYVLVPPTKITQLLIDTCKRCGVGTLTTTPTTANFAIVHEVGGLDSFHPKRFTNISCVEVDGIAEYDTTVVGGAVSED